MYFLITLLLAGFSLATQQTKCVNDSCQQIFQEFGVIATAYCVLYNEIQEFADLPSFMAPWENHPASISSACSCIASTSSRKTSSSSIPTGSKCAATLTTVLSLSTVTARSTLVSYSTVISTQIVTQIVTNTAPATPSTVISYSTLLSTIVDSSTQTVTVPPATVTLSADISVPTTITEYSTVLVIDTATVRSVDSAPTASASQPSSSSTAYVSAISSTSIIIQVSATSSSSSTGSSLHSSSSSTTLTPCTCTAYSQIAPAVAACTQITLQDISVPTNSSIDLAKLKAGSMVTFAGTTTFAFTNSSTFNPITVGGAGVTILGAPGSILDGNGQAYWDGQGSNGGVPKPDHFIVVNKMTANSVIRDLYIQNYPVHCFSISSCSDLVITNIHINNAAGNAPNSISGGLAAAHNTDGFDISTTSNMILSNSTVSNQDDCVAITSGDSITVKNMYCDGSHGLSIGSVGGKSNNNVTNILFTDSTLTNCQNGARIKSNYNTTGFISNITYSNIAVSNISVYGIDIQQDYLNGGPTGIPSNGVIITDININNLTGTAIAGAQDYYILCGDGSCSEFSFTDVSVVGGSVADSCNYPPSGCPGSPGFTASSYSTAGGSTSSNVISSTANSFSSSSTVRSFSPTSTWSSSPSSTPASLWARTSPSAGAVVVDATGATAGSHLTVQAGVNALSLTLTIPQVLFIYPGTYIEQVYIPALKSNLTVQGYTLDASSYSGNTATITYNLALLDTTSDDLTATVRQWNTNTKFYNLNIANTFGHVSINGQNLALSAHTGNQGYYGVQLWGYQDTLLANTGNQLYAKSLIVGAVDFIFGQTATAWLEQVDIRTIATGCVTASGRAAATNPSWYVINNSTVAGVNNSIPAGTNYLGRPWESFARVVFQNSYLSDVIAPAGWRPWSTAVNGTTNTENVTFAEYENFGPGSILEEGPRASFSEQLTEPVAIEIVLGDAWTDEWWVDEAFLE